MNIPFFSFEQRNLALRSKVLKRFEVFFDSKYYVLGDYTKKFEARFSEYCGTRNAVGVSSGLDALHLSLRALNVGVGDEVIVPSNTYIATVLAVSYTGTTPVFVEPRYETANINPELISNAITAKTKAIMPVHLYGQACEMDAIMKIANDHNLHVIEDNAQAQGATCHGKKTGSFGIVNATSFYPTKNLGALGEAGAITTDSDSIAERIRSLRNYGSSQRYFNDEIGYNNRIDEFEAAFLDLALDYLDEWNQERSQIAKTYRKHLYGISGIELFEIADHYATVNHLFVIKTNRRDELREHLSKNGVGTQIHYPIPPHLQKAYKHLDYKEGDFPISERLAKTSLSLPLWPGLKPEQIKYVAELTNEFFHS